jgi:hypothetical protein
MYENFVKHSGLLEYDAVLLGECFSMLWGNVVPSFSGTKYLLDPSISFQISGQECSETAPHHT